MEQQNIYLKISDFIKDNFLYHDNEKIDDSESLLETGIMDSTGVLEIVSFLEDSFSITVEDEELLPENLDSINKITGFVTNKMSAQ